MLENQKTYRGGCLCGALRYQADGRPRNMGLCYCADCRKASGSGYIPFIGFPASAVHFTGKTAQFVSKALRGGEAVRNFCPKCGSLVFGGRAGIDIEHTIYAGTLDDPSQFVPQLAIFTRDRAPWAMLPDGLTVYDRLPGW